MQHIFEGVGPASWWARCDKETTEYLPKCRNEQENTKKTEFSMAKKRYNVFGSFLYRGPIVQVRSITRNHDIFDIYKLQPNHKKQLKYGHIKLFVSCKNKHLPRQIERKIFLSKTMKGNIDQPTVQ